MKFNFTKAIDYIYKSMRNTKFAKSRRQIADELEWYIRKIPDDTKISLNVVKKFINGVKKDV